MKTLVLVTTVILFSFSISAQDPHWNTDGNGGVDPGVDFLGTTDNADLRFHTDGDFRMTLTSPAGFLGLNTTTPLMRFHVQNGGILSTGVTGTNPDLGVAGTRLMWIPDQFAFRAGRVGNSIGDPDWWDSGNVGQGSVAFGSDNLVSGDYSVAFADGNEVTGNRSIAFGSTNIISAGNAIGFGSSNTIIGTGGAAIGVRNTVNGNFGVTIGRFLEAQEENAIVFGRGVDDNNLLLNHVENSLMVGFNSTVSTLFVGPPEGEEVIGSVGIGDVTEPTERLDVRGTARLRVMPDSLPDVLITGVVSDTVPEGDYVLNYLEFTGNSGDILTGDGTWADGSGNLCDWDIVNAGQDLATGYTGACVEGNVGIGIEPAPNVKLEVTSELSSMGASGIRVRTTAFSDTTFGVFSFIQGM